MLTRGSKVFFGLALAGFVGGIVYGVITNGVDHGGVWHVITGNGAVDALLGPITFGYKGGVGDQLGYTLFMSFAVCSFGMAFASLAFRDGDPEAVAELANASSIPPVAEPNDLSQWPIVAAFAIGVMTLGLAVSSTLFDIGAGALAIAAVEWAIKSWSERVTGDPEVNRVIRGRLMHPVEYPIAAVLMIAIVVFSFSRILLTASEDAARYVGIGLGLMVFVGAVLVGTRPQLRRGLLVGAALVGAVVIVAAGVVGAVRGERKVEKREPPRHERALVSGKYDVGAALGEN